eukprot:scaffold90855_cov69-Phaeocystis_antarctica.AAC.2
MPAQLAKLKAVALRGSGGLCGVRPINGIEGGSVPARVAQRFAALRKPAREAALRLAGQGAETQR